ncbi:hypothetical protein DRN58_03400 [Thermococci archaeon]|nr:MAG: hypothetical protein DRN58_03400 [Thermococci archaeon]
MYYPKIFITETSKFFMTPVENYLYYFVALGILLLPPAILSIKKEFIKSVIYTCFIFSILSLIFQFFEVFSGLFIFLTLIFITIFVLFFLIKTRKE